jgi:hypothetical protein
VISLAHLESHVPPENRQVATGRLEGVLVQKAATRAVSNGKAELRLFVRSGGRKQDPKPQPASPQPEVQTIESPADVIRLRASTDLAREEVLAVIEQQSQIINELTGAAKRRLAALERVYINRRSAVSIECNEAIISARRIICALESRLQRVAQLSSSGKLEEAVRARDMLYEDLVIPRDAVNALITSTAIPPMSRKEWEMRLEEYVSSAEREFRLANLHRA